MRRSRLQGRSLFDLIGGAPAIEAAVSEFYRRIVADSQLAPFFEGVPLERLARHQGAFLTAALRGETPPGAAAMLRGVHAALGITDGDFDRVCGHLVGTLQLLGVSDDLIARIAAAILPLRGEIVTANADPDATCAFPALR